MRSRVPAHITESTSRDFGLEVQVNRSPLPKVNHMPNGNEEVDGEAVKPFFKGYREVIPPGKIGSEEKQDVMLPATQYVDTVASYPTEQNDTRLHGAMAALRSADTQSIPLQNYASFQPRTAPMPRACQDDLYLEGPGKNAADPRMNDRDSVELFPGRRETVDNCDLYGANVAGVLHNPTGSKPAVPTSAAPPQINNRQVGRGNLRTGHPGRPAELADRPMSTAKLPAAKGE